MTSKAGKSTEARGGGFLIEDREPSDIFTPEQITDE
jgi:hypothetical protein